jgi:hypothetical protein
MKPYAGFVLPKIGFPLVEEEDEVNMLFPNAPNKENDIDPTRVM